MKIAIVTDDGQTVSQHFGRARGYAVLTVEDGQVVERELREKVAPHLQGGDAAGDAPGGGRDEHTGPAARAKHDAMLGPIGDCECVIAGGMGRGAYDHISAAGMRPVVTASRSVEEAALEYAAGRLVDHVERLH